MLPHWKSADRNGIIVRNQCLIKKIKNGKEYIRHSQQANNTNISNLKHTRQNPNQQLELLVTGLPTEVRLKTIFWSMYKVSRMGQSGRTWARFGQVAGLKDKSKLSIGVLPYLAKGRRVWGVLDSQSITYAFRQA